MPCFEALTDVVTLPHYKKGNQALKCPPDSRQIFRENSKNRTNPQ